MDQLIALNAEFVNASTVEGRRTVKSVSVPSRSILKVSTTFPCIDIAAYGSVQFL